MFDSSGGHQEREGRALHSALMSRRIGVMGGTFDPIHHGHLVAAEEARWQFDLDKVVFVPTGQPWQKPVGVSPAEDRYLMTVIATASNPDFTVSRLEIDHQGRPTPSTPCAGCGASIPRTPACSSSPGPTRSSRSSPGSSPTRSSPRPSSSPPPGPASTSTASSARCRARPAGSTAWRSRPWPSPPATSAPGSPAAPPSSTWCPTGSPATSTSTPSTALQPPPNPPTHRRVTVPSEIARCAPPPRLATVGGPDRTDLRSSPLPTSLDLALTAASAASSKQARDVLVLDVSEPLVISDYFVICSGNSDRQVRAIAEEVERACRAEGARPLRREGERDARWVLLDFVDFVVHVFLEEERAYYDLERLWRDAPVVARSDEVGSLVTA